MEAANNKGHGGEIRKLHVIYFLSLLGGRIEHPHLIRVHHLARNGVYLRGTSFYFSQPSLFFENILIGFQLMIDI